MEVLGFCDMIIIFSPQYSPLWEGRGRFYFLSLNTVSPFSPVRIE